MTDIRFYNNDPRYEMMYALLPDPQFENLPDAPQILEDLQELSLIHISEPTRPY